MSRNSRLVLSLLQRCVAGRQLPAAAAAATRGRGLAQLRAWTSAAWTSRCAEGLRRLQPAATRGSLSLCTKAGADEEEYPQLPPYEPDGQPGKKEVYIVQVKGLPWSCSAQDLLQFFSECRICDGLNGIHFSLDKLGRPTGRAFVELEHEVDVNKALEKHRQYLGPRYVEVYEVTNSEAETILKTSFMVSDEKWVVRLRGLPFTCTEADIARFFSGLDIVEDGITIVTDRRGRNSGKAFVQFSSKKAADDALQRDRQVIGNRYIEVFPSRSAEVNPSWDKTTTPMTMTSTSSSFPQTSPPLASRIVPAPRTSTRAGFDSPATASHCVHMRGLPYQTSGVDIAKFFAPLAVSRILVEHGPEGRPNGEADVYFSHHQDAVAAMSRDRMYIGERYVELFLNSSDSDEVNADTRLPNKHTTEL